VFTSGATEANWLAVLGLAGGSGAAGGGRAAFSARDHSSAQSAAAALGERGWRVTQLPLNATGSLDVAALTTWAGENPAPVILSTTLVCGQSGTREDLSFVGRLGSGNPCMLIHADATQAFAATDIAFAESGLATLTLAAHKFGGPRGIGGLVIRATAAVRPMLPRDGWRTCGAGWKRDCWPPPGPAASRPPWSGPMRRGRRRSRRSCFPGSTGRRS
jgi:cysteine desulfurase